jgi:Domain of unknown function (DUF3854)
MQFVAPHRLVESTNLALHFHPTHLEDLHKSGLSDESIRAAGLYSMAPSQFLDFFSARSELGKRLRATVQSALCFPYQGGDFARIKLFPQLDRMKYSQLLGTPARLYLPFPVGDDPLYVTEGEKKTLAAHQAGLNAVGVGGIWTWLCKATGEPIADLNLVQWDGREVTIIPDSDVFQRVDLLRAIYALGCELRAQGASVYVAQIPPACGAKVGLDDFLVAGGRVGELEVFSLSHRIFKSCAYWHGRWKFNKALEAA